MEGEGDQNIVKSIIYGNLVQTSIGIMRALCSAIASKDHIDKIILFLKNSHNFQKYNRLIYAFRLEQQPNHLFITENSQPPLKFLEGYNDDSGLEGNGEKLLSLLQKFSINADNRRAQRISHRRSSPKRLPGRVQLWTLYADSQMRQRSPQLPLR